MTPQQTQDAAQRFIRALQRLESGDAAAAEALAELFADGAHLSNPLIDRAGRERSGRAEVAAFWKEYRAAFAGIRSEFSAVTVSDRAAGLFWRSRGQSPAGDPVDYEGSTLLGFDGAGRIARFRGYFDSRQVERSAASAP